MRCWNQVILKLRNNNDKFKMIYRQTTVLKHKRNYNYFTKAIDYAANFYNSSVVSKECLNEHFLFVLFYLIESI